LIEIKPLRPSFKIKFIEIHSKEVNSANSIKIQVSWPFKFKLEIESEDCLNCIQNFEIILIQISIQKFDLLL